MPAQMIRLSYHPTLTFLESVDVNVMMMAMMITALFKFLCLWRHQPAIHPSVVFSYSRTWAEGIICLKCQRHLTLWAIRAYIREVDTDLTGDSEPSETGPIRQKSVLCVL